MRSSMSTVIGLSTSPSTLTVHEIPGQGPIGDDLRAEL
jgi:hypothetical protein